MSRWLYTSPVLFIPRLTKDAVSGVRRLCALGSSFLLVAMAGSTAAAPAAAPAADTAVAVRGPSLEEWRTACAQLPFNRTLGNRQPAKRDLPLPEFSGFEPALEAFFGLATNRFLARADSWLGSMPRRETFFNVTASWFTEPGLPFEPFVERLVLPAESRVFLQGDLHGDIHSLLAVLGRLQEHGWLKGFSVVEPGLHLAFLGDYTDRGHYGVEVLYTLLRLKLANPDRVHLVRGNHEDVTLAARYGFLAEAQAKYGRDFPAVRVLRAYDFLPVCLYLGSGTNFMQLCHGGMEPGFNPAALLAAPGDRRVQLLGPLRQAEFRRQHPDWLRDDAESSALARRHLVDFTPEAPTSPQVLGFMWNDFTVFRDEPAFAYNPDRAFVYGRTAVTGLLHHASGPTARLRGVIRGHQHSALPDPIMNRLIAGNGLFRHWQESGPGSARLTPNELAGKIESGPSRPLPDGSVWTLNVAPDSVYGAGCQFGFAAFAVLRLAGPYADWRLTVETVPVLGGGAR